MAIGRAWTESDGNEEGGVGAMQAVGNVALGRCPVCGGEMEVVRLHCPTCDTSLEGRFRPCRFCMIDPDLRAFLETFLRARGNIKEVERELDLSYPTVRARLDAVLAALGLVPEPRGVSASPPGPAVTAPLGHPARQAAHEAASQAAHRREVLEALDRGEITADEAVQRLRGQ